MDRKTIVAALAALDRLPALHSARLEAERTLIALRAQLEKESGEKARPVKGPSAACSPCRLCGTA